MKIFKLDNVYAVICKWKDEISGFSHVAQLLENDYVIGETKAKYENRTWEKFEYQSVLKQIVKENFKDAEYTKYIEIVKSL